MSHTFARHLRLTQTNAERRLWWALRNRRLGRCKFRRQQPIGPYIVDFICFEAKLVVELDGEQHDQPDNAAADAVRTAYLEGRGFRVMRFWNRQLDESLDSVVETIFRAIRGA
ncbi:MAG: endonuclease domain-containing protein [Rhizomicrobium sp.]|jgi:adenine-specific DNA-methyltransferase